MKAWAFQRGKYLFGLMVTCEERRTETQKKILALLFQLLFQGNSIGFSDPQDKQETVTGPGWMRKLNSFGEIRP